MGSRRRLDGKGSVQVMTLCRLAGLAALCGMVVLVTWGAAGRLGFGSPDVRNTEAWKAHPRATSGIAASERIEAPQRARMLFPPPMYWATPFPTLDLFHGPKYHPYT